MAEEAPKSGHHEPSSNSDLMSSAKVLADAAQSGFDKEGPGFDKAKVAGAAEDVLEAAKTYGKLDDKAGVGQYVDKAEGYLHQYHSSSDPVPANATATATTTATEGEKKEVEKEEKSSGGGGGMLDVAKGLFGK